MLINHLEAKHVRLLGVRTLCGPCRTPEKSRLVAADFGAWSFIWYSEVKCVTRSFPYKCPWYKWVPKQICTSKERSEPSCVLRDPESQAVKETTCEPAGCLFKVGPPQIAECSFRLSFQKPPTKRGTNSKRAINIATPCLVFFSFTHHPEKRHEQMRPKCRATDLLKIKIKITRRADADARLRPAPEAFRGQGRVELRHLETVLTAGAFWGRPRGPP